MAQKLASWLRGVEALYLLHLPQRRGLRHMYKVAISQPELIILLNFDGLFDELLLEIIDPQGNLRQQVPVNFLLYQAKIELLLLPLVNFLLRLFDQLVSHLVFVRELLDQRVLVVFGFLR